MYAEDTMLCYSLNNSPYNETLSNEGLKINTRLAYNKLLLNIDKTTLMIFLIKQRYITYTDLTLTLIRKVKSFNLVI